MHDLWGFDIGVVEALTPACTSFSLHSCGVLRAKRTRAFFRPLPFSKGWILLSWTRDRRRIGRLRLGVESSHRRHRHHRRRDFFSSLTHMPMHGEVPPHCFGDHVRLFNRAFVADLFLLPHVRCVGQYAGIYTLETVSRSPVYIMFFRP